MGIGYSHKVERPECEEARKMTARNIALWIPCVLLPNAFLPGIFHGQAPLSVFGRACNMRLNNAHSRLPGSFGEAPVFIGKWKE